MKVLPMFARALWSRLLEKSSPQMTCRLKNAIAAAKGKQIRFHYNPETKLFDVQDEMGQMYFADKMRGLWLYGAGLRQRAKFMQKSYCLDQISFDEKDVVIDCGANYGDLSLVVGKSIRPENYIGFEPGNDEFQCLTKNVPEGRVFKKGLSNSVGVTTFYMSSAGADSSIIEPKNYTRKVEIETTTLDVLMEELKLSHVKLLKLEAEGFEPEILEGAEKFLGICEYVAIDGGNERGKDEQETFSSQTNILLQSGFEMVSIYFPWHRALFKRKASPR